MAAMNTDYYDSEHRHPLNRAAHFVGIPVIAAGAALAAWPHRVPFGIRRSSALMCCAGGWALLFIGHAIEGNRPVVLKRPAALWHALYWWFDQARLKRHQQ
jgi:uncharacterized membrane protein YGL010W